jgi:hypothetical protein
MHKPPAMHEARTTGESQNPRDMHDPRRQLYAATTSSASSTGTYGTPTASATGA